MDACSAVIAMRGRKSGAQTEYFAYPILDVVPDNRKHMRASTGRAYPKWDMLMNKCCIEGLKL
jgi:hypothetical protein